MTPFGRDIQFTQPIVHLLAPRFINFGPPALEDRDTVDLGTIYWVPNDGGGDGTGMAIGNGMAAAPAARSLSLGKYMSTTNRPYRLQGHWVLGDGLWVPCCGLWWRTG